MARYAHGTFGFELALMMLFPGSRSIWALTVAAIFAASAWGDWVYKETKPRQLVTRSALRNHHAALAENGQQVSTANNHRFKGKHATWKDLSPDLKKMLSPLEKRWDYLSHNQRRSLIETANRFAAMTEEQQVRFSSRLVEWTKLTGMERRQMRERYKSLKSLPPEQLDRFKQLWFEGQPTPESADGLLPT